MAYMLIFLLKKNASSICKSYSHFSAKKKKKKSYELDIELTKTVNILTTNELVKLTMLWATRPWLITFFFIFRRFVVNSTVHSTLHRITDSA